MTVLLQLWALLNCFFFSSETVARRLVRKTRLRVLAQGPLGGFFRALVGAVTWFALIVANLPFLLHSGRTMLKFMRCAFIESNVDGLLQRGLKCALIKRYA